MEILVIPTKKYLDQSTDTKFSFFKFLNKNLLFIERSVAETNEEYLQIIPYIIVRNKTHIFTYQRLKGGNEARLHAKYSIGIGGHIDRVKELEHHSNLGSMMLNHAAYAELFEELTIEDSSEFLPIKELEHLIYDPSNAVGRVHLGVLMECHIADRGIRVNEIEKISGGMRLISDIQYMYNTNPDSFEVWTQIALKKLGLV